jgi:hypothetical protein
MDIELADTATVADLMSVLGYGPTEASRLTVLLDGVRAAADGPLAGTRTADILVLIGGG